MDGGHTINDFKNFNLQGVFSDLDRTLLDDNKNISEENLKAIRELFKRSIPFVPATGRSAGSLPENIFNIPEIRYCITSNGAAVFDLKRKKTILNTVLQKGFISEFYDFCAENGLTAVEIYVSGKAYVPRYFYDDPVRFNQDRVEYVKKTRTPVSDIWDFAFKNDGNTDAVCIISPKGRLKELFSAAKEKLKNVYITNSDSLYIEISSIDSGKHNAMRRVSDMLDIDVKNCIAFGDNDNDIEMLKCAGIGVCVENGTENCKCSADIITESNVNDGVAKVIHKFLEEK